MLIMLAVPSLFVMANSTKANDASAVVVVRIEEDWEMKLIEPAPDNSSPQVTFFTYPNEDDADLYFQTQMNYAAESDFSGGGFHVAAVHSDAYLDQARSGNRQGLSTDTDTIVWTKVMAVFNGKLVFAIKDGHCTDWGSFGGPEYLVEMPLDGNENLGRYRWEQSLDAIDIGFGANRVESIELRNVRIYYSNGQIETLDVNRHYAP